MNKHRLNQIIDVMLLPFCEKSFYNAEADVVTDLRYSFYKVSRTPITNLGERRKCEEKYLKAEKALNEFVRSHAVLRQQPIDDILLLLGVFYPEQEIADMVEACVRQVCLENVEKQTDFVYRYYYQMIFKIAKSLLTFRDGKIAIRTWINRKEREGEQDLFDFHNTFDKVEIWNLFSRIVVPDVFIAAFFVECGLLQSKYLYNQTGGIFLADKTLDVILNKGIAETHMHFNAGIEYITLWEKVVNPYSWEYELSGQGAFGPYENKNRLCSIVFFRIVFAEYLFLKKDGGYKEPFEKYLQKEWPECGKTVSNILHKIYEGADCDTHVLQVCFRQLMRDIRGKYPGSETDKDFLLETVYVHKKYLQTFSEVIFLVDVLEYFKYHDNFYCLKIFFQYLRVKNEYFSLIMQPNAISGLDYFRKYFSNAVGAGMKGPALNHTHIFKTILMGQAHNTSLKKMEIRVSPDLNMNNGGEWKSDIEKNEIKRRILQRVEVILREYLKYAADLIKSRGLALESVEEVQMKLMDRMYENEEFGFPTLGIVFHFIKEDFIDNRIGDMCWLKSIDKEPTPSKHLLIWRKKMVQFAECIEELRSACPFLAEYIVGIDAASNENATEPWIIAPVYSAIRNRRITKPLLAETQGGYQRIPNIGFTYHVGEDFRHILSGLRHIDEVLDHFNYKAGDRIGHAIALGADLEYWVKNNEVVVIPVEEHLENLVWVWGSCVYGRLKLNVIMEEIEGKILEYAKQIYQNIQGITPMLLYEAYLDKFSLSHETVFRRIANDMEWGKQQENRNRRLSDRFGFHFCKFYDSWAQGDSLLWNKDKLICTFFCPIFQQKLRKPIMVAVEKSDLKLYTQIQEQMIEKIEKIGVYVETNPTSNVAIGQIDSMFTHYITKLNAVEPLKEENRHAVLVSINSDDPVVFNTNAENELSYVYHALVHNGYKKEAVLQWIDKVRQNGLDSCFIRKIKKPSVQIKEMKELLYNIEEFYKHGEDAWR